MVFKAVCLFLEFYVGDAWEMLLSEHFTGALNNNFWLHSSVFSFVRHKGNKRVSQEVSQFTSRALYSYASVFISETNSSSSVGVGGSLTVCLNKENINVKKALTNTHCLTETKRQCGKWRWENKRKCYWCKQTVGVFLTVGNNCFQLLITLIHVNEATII